MIHVEGLTKYYGDLCAVDHIDFDIKKGEIMGLLGPNGAGKTTTLRMLTGFLRPTSGTIRVKDYTIDEHTVEIKKLLGYLPEAAPLYHDMLAYDYLDYVANMRELERERKRSRIRELADLCGVSRFAIEEGAEREIRIVDLREEPRCERCWKRDGTVRERSDGGMLSDRDAVVVGVE